MSTSPRLARGDHAPDELVLNTAGALESLSRYWQTGPILLTFLRHFG